MSRRIFAPVTLLVAAFMVVIGAFLAVPGLGAQGTPAAGDTGGVHPAHIHSGTCEALGDVVFPLEDVSLGSVGVAPDATPGMMAEGTAEAAMTGTPMPTSTTQGEIVAMSTTSVEASLDDILSAEHAINVHESPENIQNYIACGDLTGEPTDGMLVIQLQELNDSGYTGEATLADNGDGTTTVTVVLFGGEGGATPEASPMG